MESPSIPESVYPKIVLRPAWTPVFCVIYFEHMFEFDDYVLGE